MNAQTLNCYSCGAAVSSDAPTCSHCGARLATISCPGCFGMMFQGSKFCPHCGSVFAQWQSSATNLPCPGCQSPMLRGTLGTTNLFECEKCFGLWLDTVTFERICRDSEQRAAVLGTAQLVPQDLVGSLAPVRYLRCPQCRQLMNRMNFAQCSGVVVDVCREHGTWFDANELHRIVHFIQAGGLDRSRDKEKRELEAERRRVQASRTATGPVSDYDARPGQNPDLLTMVVSAAGELLVHLLRR